MNISKLGLLGGSERDSLLIQSSLGMWKIRARPCDESLYFNLLFCHTKEVLQFWVVLELILISFHPLSFVRINTNESVLRKNNQKSTFLFVKKHRAFWQNICMLLAVSQIWGQIWVGVLSYTWTKRFVILFKWMNKRDNCKGWKPGVLGRKWILRNWGYSELVSRSLWANLLTCVRNYEMMTLR